MSKKMHPATLDQEAANLRAAFGDREKVAFAKAFDFPGGASMISQHLHARRPINLEHGVIYAEGLGVGLEKISPRLVELVQRARTLLSSSLELKAPHAVAASISRVPNKWPFERITGQQWGRLTAEQRRAIENLVEQLSPERKTLRRQVNR